LLGGVFILTLRIFAPWRLSVSLHFNAGRLTRRRKAAKKLRELLGGEGLGLFSSSSTRVKNFLVEILSAFNFFMRVTKRHPCA